MRVKLKRILNRNRSINKIGGKLKEKKSTWQELPQYHAIRHPEHFLKLADAKQPSHEDPVEDLLGELA